MESNKITQNQYFFIICASLIGVGILSLPADLCNAAQQNGWISVIISTSYPIFIVITASIIDNKTNHASYLVISNKIYGKVLTYIFTLIFFSYFLTILSGVTSGYANVLMETITLFLHPIYIIIPTLILIIYASLHGLKTVGRICEFYFYITLPLLILSFVLIGRGTFINVSPLKFSFDIIKATPDTFYAFSGCEICYFIISKITNKSNTKKAGIIAVLLISLIYLINVFMVIYNLGWELTSKLEVPLLYLIQTIEVPIISNFLSIVMFLWSFIVFKCILTYQYTCSDIISNLFKIDYKKANFVLFAIALIYIYFMIPEYKRRELIGFLMPCFVVFSFLWALITTILVSIKFRGVKNEVS
ncbi:GerAB/ArcD/ProY family transporter [Anaerovorax odorimutans]|uniref:GerAB/ArcD/ProY family transporter n=1 Tax=Anaerovorax odorimutans TaxID=109327 RepID=UPI0003FEA38E|nr:GerAB/ArcD/ProY family transporter [Anaerovorax odorimutans]